MKQYPENDMIQTHILPVDVVFHPSWWYTHAGITFDRDFFFHPKKRVESEQKMEQVLYERFGQYGLGEYRNEALPVIGAVHNAAGYIISEMLGCEVRYSENAAPQVISLNKEELTVDPEGAFNSEVFRQFKNLIEELKGKYGYVTGDINWGGVLNIAIDVRGTGVLMDILNKPDEVNFFFRQIATTIEQFVTYVMSETGTSSISVNRNVRHIEKPVFLHSECTHVMISNELYRQFLFPIDEEWSKKYRPFGIHYDGPDPHRFAEPFAELPYLDFVDVGWGGDLRGLRKHLPQTFLNIRLDPVSILDQSKEEIRKTIRQLVEDSDNPYLTGVCCINIDDQISDEQVGAIFETVFELRDEYNKALIQF
ncbi:MAG: hypothetical protein ACQER7_12110 [Bacteroidota bacterium]